MSTNSTTMQPPLDYSDSRPALFPFGIVLSIIATAAVGLRFWSRRLIRQSLGLDDWLCLAALFFHHIFLAAGCVAVRRGGLGRDIRVAVMEDPDSAVILPLSIYIAEIAYFYSSSLIKLSVLAFYWHVFPTWTVRLGCKILGLISIMCCIGSTVVSLVQCRPLEAIWHTELQALPTTKCINWVLFYIGTGIINCVIDFFTVALPVYEVIKLHTPRKQKIKICCVFLLGGMTCVASLIRAVTLGEFYRADLVIYSKLYVISAFTTLTEIYVAIVGACLPMLLPVYRQLRHGNPHKSYKVRLPQDLPSDAGQSGNKPLSGFISLEHIRLNNHDPVF